MSPDAWQVRSSPQPTAGRVPGVLFVRMNPGICKAQNLTPMFRGHSEGLCVCVWSRQPSQLNHLETFLGLLWWFNTLSKMHDTNSILTVCIYNHTCTAALYMSVYIHFWHICVYTQIYMLWVYIHVFIFIYICCLFFCVCVFLRVSAVLCVNDAVD